MRKRIIPGNPDPDQSLPTAWLNLEELADVEITSENSAYPIEAALLPGFDQGWRAAIPGAQTIRLLFKQPQPISRIELHFMESAVSRTQEYSLCYSRDNGQSFNEIVRQQWNFSPDGSVSESEDHIVELEGVTAIELKITPDISDQHALASLATLRVA